jgi:serine/threonine protein kinase
MLDGRGHAKLVDFGLARGIEAALPTTFSSLTETKAPDQLGTTHWMAPENMDPTDPGYGQPPGDIFSVGMVAFELGSGLDPWPAPAPKEPTVARKPMLTREVALHTRSASRGKKLTHEPRAFRSGLVRVGQRQAARGARGDGPPARGHHGAVLGAGPFGAAHGGGPRRRAHRPHRRAPPAPLALLTVHAG